MSAPSLLTPYLTQWERRWRLQKVLLWLPRVLALCWGIAALAAFVAALARGQDLLIGGVALLAAAGFVALFIIWRLSRTPEQAARYYDRAWHLQERLSTALELESGRIPTTVLSEYQLEDTLAVAQSIDTRKLLPVVPRWREWVLPLVGVVAFFAAVLLVPNLLPTVDSLPAETRQSIEDAAEALRDITALVAEDTALDPLERDALLSTLETRLDELQQSPLSAEQAFASLNEAQAALADAAAQLREASDNQAQALQEAMSAMNGQNASEASTPQDLANALQERLEERQAQPTDALADAQLAQDMQRAADLLQDQFPQLSEAMQQAAQSLENQDSANQQANLENAQREASAAAQEQSQNQQSAQQLEQSAQSMSESAQDVSQSDQQSQAQQGQQQQSQQQQSQQQGQSEQQQSQSQESQSADSQSQQQSQQAQSQQQQGQSQSQSSEQQGDSQSAQQSQQGQSDQQAQQSSQSDQASQNAQAQDNSTQGDSNQQADANQPSDPQGESAGSRESSPNVDGEGERDFDPIYAPNPPADVTGEENAQLQGDASGSPLRPGETLNLPEEQANVPYNQVFQQYAQQAGRALEGDYVPLGLKDVVREYFSALAP